MTARAKSHCAASRDTSHQTLGLRWASVVGGLHLAWPWTLPWHMHIFWSQLSLDQMASPHPEAALGM